MDFAIDVPVRPIARHLRVRGGGGIAVALRQGDRLNIIDTEGQQPALLFGLSQNVPPGWHLNSEHLAHALQNAGPDSSEALRHTDVQFAHGIELFAPDSPPGTSFAFEPQADMLCLVFAPGHSMEPDAQAPPTALLLEIDSASPLDGIAPPPLAPTKLDLRIGAATAAAYRVSAGDYIQIIDVDGRQCSDFLAFDAARLLCGDEAGLDPTTTRTLMGSATPAPGLHAKYFGADMQPFVEIIQDTVGRHDTFMLACSAKYYEDMGYPGHSNCTENFNAALKPHGVAPRKGWPAINFFYNTVVGADNAIGMDEPWSRPGDYVLLRALTDLVCASSSCTDDIDPANGWNPTDIHVRVYDGSQKFARGVAHRVTPDVPPIMTRETGFQAKTAALSTTFAEYRGFWLPTAYTDYGPVAEYWACREHAAIMDLSPLRKFEVTGPDAEALMQLAVTRDIRRLATGQIVYTAMCHEHGGILDDGTVFRMGEQNFRWICGEDYCGIWLRELAAKHGMRAWVRSSTDQLHNVALQGPNSRAILAGIVVTPPHLPGIAALKWFRFTVGRIGEIPVVVSRTGYTGELGYEIWCHPDRAANLWDAVWQAGQPHGLAPLGLAALDMLRIEAGLAFSGYEFDDQTDPFEAGIGFTVPAEKRDAFIGSAALAHRRATPQRRLVGLDVDGNETVAHGDCVHVGRAQVGVVTSATRSPILRRTIALARLDVTYVEPGTRVDIGRLDGHQKRIGATVTAFPAYDPTKARVRA